MNLLTNLCLILLTLTPLNLRISTIFMELGGWAR